MKNIILHVGPGKTGSSAIQNWLVNNRSSLANHSIFYPKHGLDVNGISAGHALNVFEYDQNHKLVLSKEKVNKIKSDFADSGCQTLLLSSEAFAMGIDEVTEEFPNAKVIYYFRNPIESAESVYNQSIKRHFNTDTFNSKRINLKRLEVFLSIIKNKPEVELDIRAYGKGFFYKGDIVSDFMFAVDPEFFVPSQSKVVNTSYSFEALEFKRALNEIKNKSFHGRLDRFFQDFDGKTKAYSFIDDVTKDKFSQSLSTKLSSILNELDYSSEHLIPVLNRASSKPYIAQENCKTEMEESFKFILSQIKQENRQLFNEIVALAELVTPQASNLKLLKNVIKQTKLSIIDKMAVYFWVVKWKLTSTKGQNES